MPTSQGNGQACPWRRAGDEGHQSKPSRTDGIDKLREYQAVPSIRRYVIVEQASIALTVFERPETGAWQASALTGDDVLHMPELGVSISLAELYVGIVPDPSTDPAEVDS